jgi:ABC-type sugar transport system ATPase subunit
MSSSKRFQIEVERVAEFQKALDIRCSDDVAIATLSGGNQQKVLLARWLMMHPAVLFLDEPTRGIDIGVKQDIYKNIDELAMREKAVILVSSELPELWRCCDRILVLHEGAQAGIVDPARTTQEEVLALATGSCLSNLETTGSTVTPRESA